MTQLSVSAVAPKHAFRNFKSYKQFEKIQPTRKQSIRLYKATETHTSEHPCNVTEKTTDQLAMDQNSLYTYNAAQVNSNYLKPRSKNEYTIIDTLLQTTFSQKL